MRGRLVATIALLAGFALVVADVGGYLLLRSYLVGRVDAQLAGQVRELTQDGRSVRPLQRPIPGNNRVYVYGAGDGTLLWAAATLDAPDGEPRLGSVTSLPARAGNRAFTVPGSSGDWRVRVTRVSSVADGDAFAVNAISLREVAATERRMGLIDAGVTALVLTLMAAAAASVVRVGLRPLTRMERIAAQIAAGDLSRRVTDADPHTEPGRLGMALNTMLARIEEALAYRSACEQRLRSFLADASHELRTPLTSIQGFAELYRRGGAAPGPALDDAMGRIEAEVGRMRLLVDDLLLLARLDEERPLERDPVDLLAIAADAVRDASLRAPTRIVRLAGLDDDRDAFLPVTVLGDESRLRQVLANLVANTLQHTPTHCTVVVRVGQTAGAPAGQPAAAVGAEPGAGELMGVVEVADTGPGMTREHARRAFERLYRADPSRSRAHGGAGLGLAIVSAIVQSHSGRVELYTADGEGARFRVLLPLRGGPLDEWPRLSDPDDPGDRPRPHQVPAPSGQPRDGRLKPA